ncbi:FAD-dependent oxidoreductase [Rhodococcus jostii]|uniref:ferredoxin--NADP(+) reductase n=1 Tax=Rhodococcus jostii TaxID=132919 RepID=A0A1H4Y2N6_RHOJO|nr:FAD-dependent oxidoreductase [Rhodococcus jostii]SED12077.1 ferredoxin--NADP+ reductase [Rhodococcus jostii]
MTHVVTQSCCNDASCVSVCPVDCIHPTPNEPGYGGAEMLYIDPVGCIDCGACIDACPVDAILPDYDLTPETARYEEINAAYYLNRERPAPAAEPPGAAAVQLSERALLRVAIVGSGPSGCYAAESLLSRSGPAVEVSVFEKLATPFGLVRFGVAPDHQATKAVASLFQKTASRRDVDFYLNVEVGAHLTHDELLAHHDAVIYAVGAPADCALEIPGEGLPGSHSATEFVAWYNGHPDHAHRSFDLSGERAVIIGNGNVALDVARVLVAGAAELRKTDIAAHALEALSESRIKEVVVVGRRGPAQAAYTNPELLALGFLPGVNVVVESDEVEPAESVPPSPGGHSGSIEAMKARIVAEFAKTPQTPAGKRIALRYLLSPVEVLGNGRVEGIRLVRNELVPDLEGSSRAVPTGVVENIDCSLVLRSVGYRGVPVAGMPVAGARSTMPNDGGRVLDPDSGRPMPGVYTVGWIKRGPSGVIGTNKACAAETVDKLVDDFHAGRLTAPGAGRQELRRLVAHRRPECIDYAGWKAIDAYERRLGRESDRPRVKLVDTASIIEIASCAVTSA